MLYAIDLVSDSDNVMEARQTSPDLVIALFIGHYQCIFRKIGQKQPLYISDVSCQTYRPKHTIYMYSL